MARTGLRENRVWNDIDLDTTKVHSKFGVAIQNERNRIGPGERQGVALRG